MSNIYIKSNSAEDWRNLLADREKHWATGYSAKSLAYSWEDRDDFPKTVRDVFDNCGINSIESLSLLYAFPEHKIALPGGNRPSQNDLYVLAKNNKGLMTIMVEGKVDETFDKIISEWAKTKSNGMNNERLNFLIEKLMLTDKKEKISEIRYQLLHRTVSAIIEAERIGASQAMILVHSFSKIDSGINDFKNFASLFEVEIGINDVQGPILINDIEVYFSWVKGDEVYLTM